MKVAVFSAAEHDKTALKKANNAGHELTFIEQRLDSHSVDNIKDCDAVCCFVVDDLSATVLERIAQTKVKLIACRSAGVDHVDIITAKKLGLTVVNVPDYSPSAVAEFAVLLVLLLARHYRASSQRFAHNNFLLQGLLAQGVAGKTVGVIGTGNIGHVFCRIMTGFDCKVIAVDPVQNQACIALGVRYVDLDTLYQESDVISLHCPLNEATQYLINPTTLKKMKTSALLVNTARGAVVDTHAVLNALDASAIAGYATDVYEHEKGLFFTDHSNTPIQDALFERLRAHPKVVVTGHQAYFTEQAVSNIAATTMANITAFANGHVQHQVA